MSIYIYLSVYMYIYIYIYIPVHHAARTPPPLSTATRGHLRTPKASFPESPNGSPSVPQGSPSNTRPNRRPFRPKPPCRRNTERHLKRGLSLALVSAGQLRSLLSAPLHGFVALPSEHHLRALNGVLAKLLLGGPCASTLDSGASLMPPRPRTTLPRRSWPRARQQRHVDPSTVQPSGAQWSPQRTWSPSVRQQLPVFQHLAPHPYWTRSPTSFTCRCPIQSS
jgi:hypothetical protein